MPPLPTPARSLVATARRRGSLLLPLVTAVLAGCGGGSGSDGGVTNPPPQAGTLALTIPTAAASVTSGGSTTVAITIARGGSFNGTVSLSVTGLPTGVTGTFAPSSLDGTQSASVLTITAATSAVAGAATLTVSATGSGVTTQTATVQLVIVQAAIAIGATPTALTIVAGGTGSSTISIGRSTGYTAAVTLTLDNPPNGITGSFASAPTQGNSSALTIAVAASVAPGAYPVTVKATAPGAADKTLALSLTITAALPIGFSIGVDPVEFELPAGKGWGGYGIVSVQRLNGFTGPVSVSISPPVGTVGSVIAPTPATIATGETMTNMFALAADGTPPGVYPATVKVTAAGLAEQTVQVRLRVSAPTTGTIQWKFCSASRVPRYFAVRDGNGNWQHIVPSGPAAATRTDPTIFSFSLSQPTAAVAMVSLGEKTSASPLIQGFRWDVYYLTAQEVAERAAAECVRHPDATTRSATGSLTGYQSFDAVVGSASSYAIVNPGSTGVATTTLTAQNLQPGPFDLFVTRSSFSAGGLVPIVAQQLILKRGVDPAAGAGLPALSFATDGLAPTTGTVTFGNTNGETFTFISNFLTPQGLNGLFHATAAYAVTTRAWYGAPNAQLQTGDLHQLVATTGTASARRAVIAYATQVSTRTLDFGPAMAAPSIAGGSGAVPPWVVRATGTLATDYIARASLYLRETIADPRAFMIVASRGALGSGSAYDVTVPDLSGATGFTAFWNLRRGAGVRWTFTGGEGDPGSTEEVLCMFVGYCDVKPVAGAIYKSAQASGTLTIP